MAKQGKRDGQKTAFWKTCSSAGALVVFYALSFVELVPVYGPVTRFDIVFLVGLAMMLFGFTLGVISYMARRATKEAEDASAHSAS